MSSRKQPDRSKMTDADLKECGNKCYAKDEYETAIEYYTAAILKNGSVSTYYSNRALCYLNLKKYDKVVEDCTRSLQLDPNNLKAYFFLGQSHFGLGNLDMAITNLTKANQLALQQHRNFGDDITSMIREAKSRRFEMLEQQRCAIEIPLQFYLTELIRADAARQCRKLRHRNHSTEPTSGSPSPKNGSLSGYTDQPTTEEEVNNMMGMRTKEVDMLFDQLDERRRKREVPDHLCGNISFDIMKDPVITPYGITYERKSIQTHLEKVGHFDPITRQPLEKEALIPNLAMKAVIDKFLEENSWADTY